MFSILPQFMCPSMWKRKIISCAFWNLNALKDLRCIVRLALFLYKIFCIWMHWNESFVERGKWRSDAIMIWWHRSGSTFTQVMAWCLLAVPDGTKPLLDPMWTYQWWTLLLLHKSNFTGNIPDINLRWVWKLIFIKLLPHLPGAIELKTYKSFSFHFLFLW